MKQEMVYRVENPVDEHGIWRNFDGSPCDLFSKLTIGECKDMPMEDNDFYLFNGKRWFSATDTPEKLKAWFDVLDIVEMRKLGYRVYRFTVSNIRTVSEYEVAFTRDSIVEKVAIDPSEIWEDIEMIAKSSQPDCESCDKTISLVMSNMSKRIHELETELKDYENKGDDE